MAHCLYQLSQAKARFLYEGEHQQARSRARFLHKAEHQNITIYSTIFVRRGIYRNSKIARFRARILYRGEHQRARSRTRFLHGRDYQINTALSVSSQNSYEATKKKTNEEFESDKKTHY